MHQKSLRTPSNRRPTLPGEILVEEFLVPLGITQSAFSAHIGITAARLSEIIHGKRALTIDTALRFERALGMDAETWLRLQLSVDLYDAKHGELAKIAASIKPIKPQKTA
ncbi:virulence associated protein [Vulcanimicrobium alpinum]|uniref:Virulence associated protein n=1 Tax=Vulcanimicrobium alpinum TaxID=3016050 RepID=A0AAN1XXX4_UNVUL|nr:HigA family addiction module antitoxin [Vulcanimicrobium alpinum]BDE06383.1 virulence associated protein [Vulcanimicrobium alpinum]